MNTIEVRDLLLGESDRARRACVIRRLIQDGWSANRLLGEMPGLGEAEVRAAASGLGMGVELIPLRRLRSGDALN